MDRQEFFQSYMDHWGLADVLLDCYVDLLTRETTKDSPMISFKQLLAEHHIRCKEQENFEAEIRQLRDDLKRLNNK